MWHVLMAYQPKSFLPFSSRQSFSCCLSRVALLSYSIKALWSSLPSPPKPHGPLYSLHQSYVVLSLVWLPHLGLNPCTNLPLQPYFQLLPQSATPASIPIFFQLFWAAVVSLGRHGPVAWSKSSPRSHAGCCNQGELLPSYILGGSHSHLPGSKHYHSYLTYP